MLVLRSLVHLWTEWVSLMLQDIGDILAQRTSRRLVQGSGKSGGTFSVASFRAGGDADAAKNADADDSSFWRDLLPKAVLAQQNAESQKLLTHGKRTRRQINYHENNMTPQRRRGDQVCCTSVAFDASLF